MPDRTLFERLEAAGEPAAALQYGVSGPHAAVLESLRRILNDRQGCCETRPDYGMPDLNALMTSGAQSIFDVARAVRFQIEQFEPRLKQVQVTPRPDPDRPTAMAFEIQAVLQLDDEAEKVSFSSVLSGDRRVEVSG